MSTTDIQLPDQPVAAQRAGHVGQATVIEQARAVAEVQAAIVVAQQCPRSVPAAVAAMEESCRQEYLAQRAFFRYNRAGSQITGPSVHLARELARCWGNLQYGIAELRRDDKAGESEMQAYAWDVQTNTRSVSVFVVKHLRDTTKGTKQLTEQRDIYENNANMGARRLREAIFSILPTWFTEQAKEICNATIKHGGGKPLAQRVAEAVKAFAGKGISQRQLEDKLGRRMADWIDGDVAQLVVVFRSLENGETTIEDEFPTQRVTGEELAGQPPASSTGRVTADEITTQTDPAPTGDTPPAQAAITKAQLTKLHTVLTNVGYTDREHGLAYYERVIGRRVESSKDLTKAEAVRIIDSLENTDGADVRTGEVTEAQLPADGSGYEPSDDELAAMAEEMS